MSIINYDDRSDDTPCKDYIARQAMLEELSKNTIKHNVGTKTLIENITHWHHERNLIEGSTDKDQFCKLIQEAGELSDSICKGNSVADDIGDMIVVLINIAERNKLSISECLAKAWDDIKDRKGQMVDGVFVKEADL